MATATAKGFNVTCPHCHDSDATIALDLNNVHALTCSSCNEEFTPAKARDLAAAELARWEAVCRWVELAADVMAAE